MPYVNEWEEKGVYRKYDGAVTSKEILRAVQEVEADARFDDIRYVISDFLDISDYSFECEDIVLLASIDSAAAISNPDINVAVVMDSPGMMEAVKIYTDSLDRPPYPTQTFATLTEARAWVNA